MAISLLVRLARFGPFRYSPPLARPYFRSRRRFRMQIWPRGSAIVLGFCLCVVILAAAITTGCAQNKISSKSLNPFAAQKKKGEAIGIRTSAKTIEEMKELEKVAKKASPAAQEKVASELAMRIQVEQDPLVRIHMVTTLGAYPVPRSADVLKAALNDSDADVRVACCKAWGRRGGPEAVQELQRVVASDTNVDVRLAAARALGQTKDKSAIPALGEALADNDPAMQYRAVEALKEVSGRDLGNDVAAWREFAKSGKEPAPPTIAERFRGMFR